MAQWPHGHRDVPRGVPGEVARSRSAARGGLAAVHHTGPGAAASKPPGGRKGAAVYVALGGEEWEGRAALLGALRLSLPMFSDVYTCLSGDLYGYGKNRWKKASEWGIFQEEMFD